MSEQEVTAVEPVQEEQKQPTIYEVLSQLGGPDQEQIEAWKLQHGGVYVAAHAEDSVYVFRALKRFEYRQFQTMLTDPEKKMDQYDYEEAVCRTCTLWPDPSKSSASLEKGGTATTLSEQIFQNSNFFNPQQAAALVMKL